MVATSRQATIKSQNLQSVAASCQVRFGGLFESHAAFLVIGPCFPRARYDLARSARPAESISWLLEPLPIGRRGQCPAAELVGALEILKCKAPGIT
jgi:hypothetical protein